MFKSKSKTNEGVISHPLYPTNASQIALGVAIVWRHGGYDPVSLEPVSVAVAGRSDSAKPQLQWRKALVHFYERLSAGAFDLCAGTLEVFTSPQLTGAHQHRRFRRGWATGRRCTGIDPSAVFTVFGMERSLSVYQLAEDLQRGAP